MRKFLLMFVAIGAVVVTGAASAKTVTVSITKAGYVPKAATIAQGDSVQFTNSDTVAHQVVFKTTTGITCAPNPLVLQPAQSGTCAFQAAGSFTYSDPNVKKGNTFRGSVTVTGAQEALTLSSAPRTVVYGTKVTLSGTLSTHKTGENVDVFAQACGASAATKTMTVQTTTNGVFSAIVPPLMNTTYMVKVRNTTSPAATVSVRPTLRLGKLAPHRYSLRVSAAQSFAGKYATLPAVQRHSLGRCEERASSRQHDRRRADRDLIGHVPLGDQGTVAGPRCARDGSGRHVLPARHEQHDSQLRKEGRTPRGEAAANGAPALPVVWSVRCSRTGKEWSAWVCPGRRSAVVDPLSSRIRQAGVPGGCDGPAVSCLSCFWAGCWRSCWAALV